MATDEHFAATRKALAEQMGAIDAVLPGSVVKRLMRCNAGYACRADPPTLHERSMNGRPSSIGTSISTISTDGLFGDGSATLPQRLTFLDGAQLLALA